TANPLGTTANRVLGNADPPAAAVAAGSGVASTMAASMAMPKTPDTATERTIPRGTATAAWTVSSDTWADASNPVIVYAGRSRPSANSQPRESVFGQTSSFPSGSPLKLVSVTNRDKSQ